MDTTLELHGIVLKHRAAGDYDWLVTLLTAERGKINAFARGARKPSGKLSGNTEPFSFGSFFLYAGKNSYVLQDAKIDFFFESFRKDLKKAAYGTFCLELADYYTRENIGAADFCNLLYLTLRVIEEEPGNISLALVRCVFELRALVVEGLFPGAEAFPEAGSAVKRALSHIGSAPLNKLYSFTLSKEPLKELCRLTEQMRRRQMDRKMNSLEMLSLYE